MQTSKEYFTSLTIVHGAMLIGQVLFAAVAWFLNQDGPIGDPESLSVLRIIVPVVLIGGLVGNQVFTRMRLPQLQAKEALGDKLTGYRSLLIIRYALLEGPILLAVVTYLLGGDMTVLLVLVAIMAYFAIQRPTREGAIQALKLNGDEERQVRDPEAKVIPISNWN